VSVSCAFVIGRVHAILAALAVLAFIAAMAVASPPAHAVPLLGEDNKLIITIDMKVTVKSDDTFEASFVITDQTNYSLAPPIMAYSSFSCLIVPLVSAIFPFFVMVQTRLSLSRTPPPPKLQLFYAATFPGEVTQSQGGKVEGEEKNTVSFTDFKGRIVKGKDRPASETTTSKVLPWIIEGVGSLVVIGLIAMAVVVRRRQRSGQGAPGAAMQAVPVPGPVGRSRWRCWRGSRAVTAVPGAAGSVEVQLVARGTAEEPADRGGMTAVQDGPAPAPRRSSSSNKPAGERYP